MKSLHGGFINMCIIDDCNVEQNKGHGLCAKHYSRWRRHHDPLWNKPRGYQHGMSKTGIHKIWKSMRSRCDKPNDVAYNNYGGRGIRVCERWQKFINFFNDMGHKPVGKSIDRIDNNGDYSPENCHWVTQKEQCRNMRKNKMLKFNGETKCLSEWAEVTGFNKSTIAYRLNHGWSVEKALTQPSERPADG
jgi:hypothetical protein